MTDSVCFCGNFARGMCTDCGAPTCSFHAAYDPAGMLVCPTCTHWRTRGAKLDHEIRLTLLDGAGAFRRGVAKVHVVGGPVWMSRDGGARERDGFMSRVALHPTEPRYGYALAALCERHGIDDGRIATAVAERLASERDAASPS